MSAELEELKKKIARKDATIEELTEQLRASPDEKQKALNDMFSRLQDKDWNLRKLYEERSKLTREGEEKDRRILNLLRMQAEASNHVSTCNLAMRQLESIASDIVEVLDGDDSREGKLDIIRGVCESFLRTLTPQEVTEEEMLEEEQPPLPLEKAVSADPAA